MRRAASRLFSAAQGLPNLGFRKAARRTGVYSEWPRKACRLAETGRFDGMMTLVRKGNRLFTVTRVNRFRGSSSQGEARRSRWNSTEQGGEQGEGTGRVGTRPYLRQCGLLAQLGAIAANIVV